MSSDQGTAGAAAADTQIVLSRFFDAPRELVWQAFTEPAHAAEWWGPRGFTTTTHEHDLREGGVWLHTMHGPDGTDYPNRVTFREITPPERIVIHDSPDARTTPLRWRGEFSAEVERG
jgi:uncharacterized protein YndB with AHSA1/START domain